MNLSSEACLILNEPMKYLDLEHGQKGIIDSHHIWNVLHRKNYEQTGFLSLGVFVKALMSIRKFASRMGGKGGEKDLVHASILNYSKKVCHRFKSLNQLNIHLKGLYGCEIPKKFRGQMYELMMNSPLKTSVTPPSEPTMTNIKEVNLGGMRFTLSKGSSLYIGELEIKSLDSKGLKSVTIQKIANSKLYGLNLES